MVFEYTDDERKQINNIDDQYAPKMAQLVKEQNNLDQDSDKYFEKEEEYYNLRKEYVRKVRNLQRKFEKSRFDQLGNDPEAILANGKEQTELIVQSLYTEAVKSDLVKDEKGNLVPRKGSKGLLYKDSTIELIKSELTLHFKALRGTPEGKELRNYIQTYIDNCPFILIETPPEEEGEEETAAIEKKHPVPKINTYGIMNDKVNKTLINGDSIVQEADGQMRIIWGTNQAGIKKEEKVPVYVAMRYEGTETKISKKMTAFDMAVYNAVSTLYYYHNRDNSGEPLYVTPQDVWRTMNGIKDSRKPPTSKQTASVKKSLDKMRFTNFYMDISQEIDAHYITFNDERVKKGHIETYLLKADVASFETEKGNIVDGYRIENEPILYSYNNAKNHVLFVNYDLLDTSDTTGNEGYTVEFRNYLLQQIQLMNNHTRNSRKILYETIYKETAIPSPADRIKRTDYATEHAYNNMIYREAQNDRKKIAALLDSWKSKGWIKDYKPIMKGRSYAGVEILLQPEQKQLPDKK